MSKNTMMVNVADLKDPNDPDGKTYRQVNAEREHQYDVGDLVALESGVRLFIVKLTRDCDQTPLYSLGLEPNPSDFDMEYNTHGGYSEPLTMIKKGR